MRLWIKYDSVSFKAAETCQDCHLFSDSIAVKWQFKRGGLSLSWQVFNLCSISARWGALFCIHCFSDRLSSPGLCCFLALSPSLPLTSWLLLLFFPSLLQFHLVLYSNSIAGLEAHKQNITLPTLTGPATFDHLPQTNHWAGKTLASASCFFGYPSSHCSSTPPPPPFTPQAWRSFLCSWHLFCWLINWDEHVGWRPMEGELRPPR